MEGKNTGTNETVIESITEKTEENKNEDLRKNKKGIIIIIISIIVFLLVAAVVSIIVFGNRGDNKTKYAKIAATALENDIRETIESGIVLRKVYVKENDSPVEYKNDVLEEYNYTDIIARVYIEFFTQTEIGEKMTVSPMTCCVFVNKNETANILYYFDDDTIKSMYRSSVAGSDYTDYILIIMVNKYHQVYDEYFPNEAELSEWTEIPVKDGQKGLSIDEILG